MPVQAIGDVFTTPQDLSEVPRAIRQVMSGGVQRVTALVAELGVPVDAAAMLEAERHVRTCFAGMADQVLAIQVALAANSDEVRRTAREKAKVDKLGEGVPLSNKGRRRVAITLLGVTLVTLVLSYFAPDRSRCPGRRRGKRRGSGSGCYPILDQLGFIEKRSPALASDIARYACALSSLEEAREALAIRGVNLDVKSVRHIAQLFGDRALRCREQRLTAFQNGTLERTDEFAGKRVSIQFDGGRTRTRVSGKCGRRRKKTKRRGFKTPWREPKIFILYELDGRGRKTRKPPIYQGTFAPWEKLFELAAAECYRRGVTDAAEGIVASDGSNSIWDRVDGLITKLKLPSNRVTKVLDFFHAVEHLGDLAKLCTRWSKKERGRWVAQMKKHLRAGRVDNIIAAGTRLAVGRNAKKIKRELAYFRKRKEFMRYADFRKHGVPRGSGAVESAIRRLVNLRLKSPGIFWEVENAERMLVLRAHLKAGRWSEIENDAFSEVAYQRRCLQPWPELKAA